MAYSDFTLASVQRQFHLTIHEAQDLFVAAPEVSVSDFLRTTLDENVPLALAIQTEKARSELIIAPILVELRKLLHRQISLFSGVDFSVDPDNGLNSGHCSGDSEIAIDRASDGFYTTGPDLFLRRATHVRTG